MVQKTSSISDQKSHPLSFDLSDVWLDTLARHVFSADEITPILFEESEIEKYWFYRYRKSCREGWLKAAALLPIANYYTTYNYPLYSHKGVSYFNDFYHHLRSVDWDFIDFGPIPNDSRLFEDVIGSANNNGMSYETFYQHTNRYLDVDGRSFDEYFINLPKKAQNTIKRKGNKLKADASAKLTIYTGNEAKEHIYQFHEVYEKSWKSEEGYLDFITDIMGQFSDLGWIRLGFVYLDGVPIASQFWIVKDGVAYIYKLAYVEGFEKFSAGTLLTTELMKYVIDHDKVSRVDFLTGDDGYKKDWMSHTRELWGIRVYNKTFKGFILAVTARLKRVVKSIYAERSN